MKLSINQFRGEAPKIAPRLLPESAAQLSEESKVMSGELRPFFSDTKILDLDDDIVSVYKWYVDADKHTWIVSNRKFFIEKSPTFNDAWNRIIINYPDTKETRITDLNKVNLSVDADGEYLPVVLTNSNTYSLSVPRITSAIMAVNGTGTANIESRSYAIALVREWHDGKLDVGSLYAPVKTADGHLTVDVASGQTVTISGITLPDNAYSDAGVRIIYIYRSTVGSDGTIMYGYVGSVPVQENTTVYSFTDDVAAEDVEEAAVSSEWDPVPNLQGIISLSNGVFVGFDGYDIYFSYPYQAHAWPYTYRVSVDYEIVGLGAFGNTVVVCTKGCPYLVLVSDPAFATVRSINMSAPCLSAESILSTAQGVIYSSTEGLILINSTSPTYLTAQLVTKDEWINYHPYYLTGAFFLGNYIGVSTKKNSYSGFILNISNPSLGLSSIRRSIVGLYSDIQTNNLYFIINTSTGRQLILYDTPTTASDQYFRTMTWKSKIFTSREGIMTLSAARVRADYIGYITFPNTVYIPGSNPVNGEYIHKSYINSPVNMQYVYDVLNADRSVIFKYYVDGEERFTKTLFDAKPFRLPSGFRGDEIEVEIISQIPIHSIELASSMGELL